jgi:predicted XRE-type DNA-binding protein
MTDHTQDIEFEESSGNVFADLGLPSPTEELSKAKLVWAIRHLVTERHLDRTQAAGLLKISQPKASKLLTGQTKGFSTEKLLEFITRFDRDVKIVIAKKPASAPSGRLLIQSSLFKSAKTRPSSNSKRDVPPYPRPLFLSMFLLASVASAPSLQAQTQPYYSLCRYQGYQDAHHIIYVTPIIHTSASASDISQNFNRYMTVT